MKTWKIRISERTAALAAANEKLSNTVVELESRSREIGLLSEMADILQTCVTPEEAYAAIARTAPRLFPGESGLLGVIAEFRRGGCLVGDSIGGERLFTPGDCWALRRGRPHLLDGNDPAGMLCWHLGMAKPCSFLCVPMMAQGEALGVLHMHRRLDGAALHAGLREDGRESRSRLAVALAEQIALANLRLRESLRLQAVRDPLTGLFNRRYMEESLERELRRAARSHFPLGLILLDLDGFKGFNDLYGHAAGDALLRELANFLRSQVRGEDIACRYGGEEFVLTLPEASLEASVQRTKLLQGQVKYLQVTHEGRRLGQATLSFGVALSPRHGRTVEALLSSADQALYRAKARGRDRGEIADLAAPQLGLSGHLSASAERKHA